MKGPSEALARPRHATVKRGQDVSETHKDQDILEVLPGFSVLMAFNSYKRPPPSVRADHGSHSEQRSTTTRNIRTYTLLSTRPPERSFSGLR